MLDAAKKRVILELREWGSVPFRRHHPGSLSYRALHGGLKNCSHPTVQ